MENHHNNRTCGLTDVQTNCTPREMGRCTCPVCNKTCSTRSTLRDHVAKHIYNLPVYECTACRQHFSKKSLYELHLRQNSCLSSSGVGYVYRNSYQCTVCGRRFVRKRTCVDHTIRHGSMAHSCNVCGWTFDTLYRVNVHKALRHSDRKLAKKPGITDVKEESFEVQSRGSGKMAQGRRKRRSHDSRLVRDLDSGCKNNKYKCPKCDSVFSDESEFRSHCMYEHNTYISKLSVETYLLKEGTAKRRKRYGSNKYTCPICKRGFVSDDHVNNHSEMIFKCPVKTCGFMYKDKNLFTCHCNKLHGLKAADLRKVGALKDDFNPDNKCGICGRNYVTKDHIENHDKMIFKCPVETCGFMYQNKNLFTCHCNKIHGLKTADLRAIGALNDGARQTVAKCEICGRTNVERNHIENHDKMVFKCPLVKCGWMYNDKRLFVYHCNKKHGMKTDHLQRISALNEDLPILKHECKICGRRNITMNHIKNHDKMMFKCPVKKCGFMYLDKNLFTCHCNKMHGLKAADLRALGALPDVYAVGNHPSNKCETSSLDDGNHGTVAISKNKITQVHEKNRTTGSNSNKDTQRKFSTDAKLKQCKLCGRKNVTKDHEENHHKMIYKCPGLQCGWMYENYMTFKTHCVRSHKMITIGFKTFCRVDCDTKPDNLLSTLKTSGDSQDEKHTKELVAPAPTGHGEIKIEIDMNTSSGGSSKSDGTSDSPRNASDYALKREVNDDVVEPVQNRVQFCEATKKRSNLKDVQNYADEYTETAMQRQKIENAPRNDAESMVQNTNQHTEATVQRPRVAAGNFEDVNQVNWREVKSLADYMLNRQIKWTRGGGIQHPEIKCRLCYKCNEPTCAQTFDTLVGFKDHFQQSHHLRIVEYDVGEAGGEHVYLCTQDNCKCIFNDFRQFYRHSRKEHSCAVYKQFEINFLCCPYCGRNKVDRGHIANHDKMIYKCPGIECGFMYSDLDHFKTHMSKVHNIRKPGNMDAYRIVKLEKIKSEKEVG